MKFAIVRTAYRHSRTVLLALEQRWPYLLVLFSCLFLVVTAILDYKRPLWNDELFTLYISQQRTLHDVWKALLTGADQSPFFFFVITKSFTRLFGASPAMLRLPETLGFLLMNVCTFFFVRRRVAAGYGLLAFMFPAVTDAYYLAVEARPYGLAMGFCTLAMLCWQSAADGRHRPLSLIGTAVFLGCAVNSHYYAVLLLIPFGIAELVRYFENRRFDWGLYAAIAVAPVPLILSLPFIRASTKYSSHFWAKPSWTSLISFYENLLMPAAFTLTLLVLIAGLRTFWRSEAYSDRSWEQRPRAYEFGLAAGLLLLPIVAVCLAKLVTGAFTARYAVYSVIGLSILLSWSVAGLNRNRRALGLVLAGIAVGCWLVLAVRRYQQFVWNQETQDQTFAFLSSAAAELPVVIASPHDFFVHSHVAASRGHHENFVYLADVPLALKYTGTDSVERELMALADYAPLHLEDYRSYLASHRSFLLFGFPDPFGWVLQDLLKSGRSISVKGRNGDSLLYLVEDAPRASGPLASPTR